ncbi:MAG: threonine synthase, partial [Clostridia bacterium]|nr:threonine synthase [Clostridia bacterium]
ASLFEKLAKDGVYKVNDDIKAKMDELFFGDFSDDAEVDATIKNTFEKFGYLLDTHTAVAFDVYSKYAEKTGDNTPVVIASTASPYKFYNSILSALGSNPTGDKFADIEKLSRLTGTDVPKPIAELKNAKVRFTDVYSKDHIIDAVKNSLGI